jgi:hypothetical protein
MRMGVWLDIVRILCLASDWQTVENGLLELRYGWMSIERGSDKAGYELRKAICTYKVAHV